MVDQWWQGREWVWRSARWGDGRSRVARCRVCGRRGGHCGGRIVGLLCGRSSGRRDGRLCDHSFGRRGGRLCDHSSGRRGGRHGGRLSSGNSCCRGDPCRSRCGDRRLCRRRRARFASTLGRCSFSAAAHGGDFLLGSATLNASVDEYLLWAWGSRRGPRGRDARRRTWLGVHGWRGCVWYVWMFCMYVCMEERRRM